MLDMLELSYTSIDLDEDYESLHRLMRQGVRSLPVIESSDGKIYIGTQGLKEYLKDAKNR